MLVVGVDEEQTAAGNAMHVEVSGYELECGMNVDPNSDHYQSVYVTM